MNEFISMGGYALYVWGAAGMTALLVAGEVLALRSRTKAIVRQHQRALRRERHPTDGIGGRNGKNGKNGKDGHEGKA
ncbi:heme exporter protein CcmD [Noviherbaspirillum galbum]|nr:heme exporter protein CcmD [Noviherbaspirillum galbum]